ncbi:uncharacterized protein LOC122383461 isoform X2 [Amphibalanus amphitrite]|uniref:uncharacterized protein LOC122383461 isoform X2 n=1 Tax=Amphibalanus amphitrite TaxID=1232801 RepID=UPI001C914E07|nr:uncharacterized protein LOC122383461 isoform X2 [Amphibalanus amphitrite]
MREPATEGAGANRRLDKRQRSGKQIRPARPGEDTAPAAGRLQCVSGTSDGGRSCFSCVRAPAAAIISRRWDAPHAKGHPHVLPPVVNSDTLYRDQVPTRYRPADKPQVDDPADYDVYFDPGQTYSGPAVVEPVVVDTKPKYQPKPFVPRERKQVQKLQPAGPLLYPAPEQSYAAESRYAPAEPVQDLSKVPGYPGKDYPVYAAVPDTKFTCESVPYRPGLYADVEAGCQAYHICEEDNRHGYTGADFLCTNGTIFNQYELTCDWWYNVDCASAAKQYDVNLDPYKNPYLPTPEEEAKKKAEQKYAPQPQYAPEPQYAPQRYAPEPQYAPQPQRYAPQPQRYAPQPQRYAPEPQYAQPQYTYGPGFGARRDYRRQ